MRLHIGRIESESIDESVPDGYVSSVKVLISGVLESSYDHYAALETSKAFFRLSHLICGIITYGCKEEFYAISIYNAGGCGHI